MSRIKDRLRKCRCFVSFWHWIDRIGSRLRKPFCRPRFQRLYGLDLRQEKGNLDKRALLSYIVHPFYIPREDPRFLYHINIWCAREMVKVLNDLGYIVDVIDYRDVNFIPRKNYELFIGHGGVNYQEIASQLPATTIKIYFSTGCYWRFHNREELARFAALRERKGINLPPDRLITNSEEGALVSADGIIGIGNDFTRETYRGFSPVIMVNDTALFDSHFEGILKDYDRGREHFLFFAGSGNVHKGLDLLLESFSQLDLHLWICSHLDARFVEAYAYELQNCPNIHSVGWIQLRSPAFYELVDKCNYIILPSCSEGQAHSVIECMNQGLIPVVSQATGIDVEDYGVFLEPCEIETIKEVVVRLAEYPVSKCKLMSWKARQAAVSVHSESAFYHELANAIQMIRSNNRDGHVTGRGSC